MILAAAALALLSPPRAQEPPPIPLLEERIQERLDGFRAEAGIPGVSVGFVLPDGRVGAVASGWADVENRIELQTGHRLLSGSIGKMYVVATLLHLVEEGRIGLDDPLSKHLGGEEWFPRLQNHGTVTILQLLRHRSGISEHVQEPDFLRSVIARPDRVWEPSELLSGVLGRAPLFEPGSGWSYADTNYVLVGMVIEEAAGAPYERVLVDRVLRPSGLAETALNLGRAVPRTAVGYPALRAEELGLPARTIEEGRFFVDPRFEYCGGGLRCTPRDLARWGRMFFRGEVFPEEYLEQVLTTVPAETGPGERYGLGVQQWPGPHGAAVGHSGWFPGYLSQLAWFPDHALSVAVQFNTDDVRKTGAPRELVWETASILLDALPEPGGRDQGESGASRLR